MLGGGARVERGVVSGRRGEGPAAGASRPDDLGAALSLKDAGFRRIAKGDQNADHPRLQPLGALP